MVQDYVYFITLLQSVALRLQKYSQIIWWACRYCLHGNRTKMSIRKGAKENHSKPHDADTVYNCASTLTCQKLFNKSYWNLAQMSK